MNNRIRFAGIIVPALVAVFLLLPALHYSFDTLMGLVERNYTVANNVIDEEKFDYYLATRFIFTDPERLVWFLRFRPFFDIWNGLIWKYFGDDAFVFNMNRWAFTFGALALSIAAFLRASRRPPAKEAPHQTDSNLLQVVPVALLAYVWLFFPNPIFTLFEGIEVNTVFFLGVSNYAAALMLTAGGGGGKAPCVVLLGLPRFAAFQRKQYRMGALAVSLLLGIGHCARAIREEIVGCVRVDRGLFCCLVENNHSLGNGRGQRHALRPQLTNF